MKKVVFKGSIFVQLVSLIRIQTFIIFLKKERSSAKSLVRQHQNKCCELKHKLLKCFKANISFFQLPKSNFLKKGIIAQSYSFSKTIIV